MIFSPLSISARPSLFVHDFGPLLSRPKTHQKTSLPKSIKISKNHTLDTQGFNFDHFLMPYGPQFSINFRDHLGLLICDEQNAKTFFYHFRPPTLTSKSMKNHNLWTPFLDLISLISFNVYFTFSKKVVDCVTPSKSRGRQNGRTQTLERAYFFALKNNANTYRNASWIEPSFLVCFSFFAIPKCSGTAV